MTTDIRPLDAGLPSADDISSADIISAVGQMYARHPFPPPQRKNSYRRHAAYTRQFLRERGITPEGSTFGDIA